MVVVLINKIYFFLLLNSEPLTDKHRNQAEKADTKGWLGFLAKQPCSLRAPLNEMANLPTQPQHYSATVSSPTPTPLLPWGGSRQKGLPVY